jgi:hypothetical protein
VAEERKIRLFKKEEILHLLVVDLDQSRVEEVERIKIRITALEEIQREKITTTTMKMILFRTLELLVTLLETEEVVPLLWMM